MKRLILATAAALALAACSDASPVIDTRAPPGGPNYVPFYEFLTQTIFTYETPTRTSIDADGGREVGTRFTVYEDGKISGFRFWKAVGETGTHTAKLWTTSGTLLASATFSNETSSGWQSVSGGTVITAGTYVVSVNTNVQMVKTPMYFDTAGVISHYNDISADLSYHGQPAGSFPTTAGNGIYFVDVKFRKYLCDTEIDDPCPV